MLKCKKVLCLAISVVLMLSLFCGCSTPKVAATVNDRDYSTGEYLAYLFNTYSMLYNDYLYQYKYYGMDIWSQTAAYEIDGKDVTLGMADYIIETTKDTIVRQKAVEELMEKYQISVSDEDRKEFEEDMKSVSESTLLSYGFNRENYEKMALAYNYHSRSLFYGLYGKGGEREMSEADIKAYIEKNYLSYQLFSIALTDDDNKDFSDTLKAKIQSFLKSYQKQLETSGDFKKVFDAYVADLKKGVKLKDDKGTLLATLSWGTTAAVVTLPSDKKDEDDKKDDKKDAETDDSAADTDADKDKKEEEPTCDRITSNKSEMSDEDMAQAIEKVAIGKSDVVVYSAGGSAATAALIARYNPMAGKDSVTVDSEREDVIYHVHYETFDDEVNKHIESMTISFNDRAISMCRPEYFDPDYKPGQTTTTTTTTATSATTASSSAKTTTTTTGSTTAAG